MKISVLNITLLATLTLAGCGEEAEPVEEPPVEAEPAVEESAAEEPTEEEPAVEEPTEEESAEEEPTEEEAMSDQTPEGLETEIINEAVEADFEMLTAGEYGEEVLYVTGEATEVENEQADGATFTLETDGGPLVITNMSETEVTAGDSIVVYGTYGGEDEASGLPNIIATVITGVTEEDDANS
ncbi:hypothetical protein [Planococcus lenghuensis]|uniref:Uncharacterized protein n=1 Tax=Planococcus lenghuensis TaxID=2213202 RepID=A0A1Q2L185_9BACL|nr:hypothetical protein [Planococcus lenghuensis]AQQ54191.1 hypothetical protein B0X71_14490 [Planococcus lenghuensis]